MNFDKWLCDHSKKSNALTEQQIQCIENKYGFVFPDQYRDFLVTKGFVRKNLAKRHHDCYEPIQQTNDWKNPEKFKHYIHDFVREGLVFDVVNNDLWFKSWGEKPDITNKKVVDKKLQSLLDKAPKLIPIHHHRFVFAKSDQCNTNVVISVHQSDIIVYGSNLYNYLANEFHNFNSEEIDMEKSLQRHNDLVKDAYPEIYHIPFWGEIIQQNENK